MASPPIMIITTNMNSVKMTNEPSSSRAKKRVELLSVFRQSVLLAMRVPSQTCWAAEQTGGRADRKAQKNGKKMAARCGFPGGDVRSGTTGHVGAFCCGI